MNTRKITYIRTASGCHEVITHKSMYPSVRKNGKLVRLHRHVYEFRHGPIPDGLLVRHKCDNPHCINIDHLELGTHLDNSRDAVERNRVCFGERKPNAKLKNNQIAEILIEDGTQQEIAKKYGVTQSLISKIRTRKIWTRHDLLTRNHH